MRTLQPSLVMYQPRLGYQGKDRERNRHVLQPWRPWYASAKWKKLREAILLRDHYTCCECGEIDPRPGHMVVDHRHPHKGDPVLFWDVANLQAMCKGCHDGPKQRHEKAKARRWR